MALKPADKSTPKQPHFFHRLAAFMYQKLYVSFEVKLKETAENTCINKLHKEAVLLFLACWLTEK
jgi:hypothetical protein